MSLCPCCGEQALRVVVVRIDMVCGTGVLHAHEHVGRVCFVPQPFELNPALLPRTPGAPSAT